MIVMHQRLEPITYFARSVKSPALVLIVSSSTYEVKSTEIDYKLTPKYKHWRRGKKNDDCDVNCVKFGA